MNHQGQDTLAHTCCGHVKMCATGCVHVTFGQVTLHLHSPEEFEAMAQAVAVEADARQDGEAFDLSHAWFSMSLNDYGSREFTRLVLEALANLAWKRGDYEFTDDDLFQIRTRSAS